MRYIWHLAEVYLSSHSLGIKSSSDCVSLDCSLRTAGHVTSKAVSEYRQLSLAPPVVNPTLNVSGNPSGRENFLIGVIFFASAFATPFCNFSTEGEVESG